ECQDFVRSAGRAEAAHPFPVFCEQTRIGQQVPCIQKPAVVQQQCTDFLHVFQSLEASREQGIGRCQRRLKLLLCGSGYCNHDDEQDQSDGPKSHSSSRGNRVNVQPTTTSLI